MMHSSGPALAARTSAVRESSARKSSGAERGLALLAVLFALTLLMLLALPFAISMSVGADAAMRDVEQTSTEQTSASVRALMLADVALSHSSVDATPDFDGRGEFPNGVELPAAFAALEEGGRVLLGGEVQDLQRYASLDSMSPLMLANTIGTATRLGQDLEPDATSMAVDDASAFPDKGYLWLANEVVSYDSIDGNVLQGLQRGLFRDQGFGDGTEGVATRALVLDYRCVLASIWPYFAPDRGGKRVSYRSEREVLDIGKAGLGTFTLSELDAIDRVFAVEAQSETAATWGRPERVFNELEGGLTRTLMVKSAVHMGSGSTVRIRDLATGRVEYGMLMAAATQRAGQAQLQLPSVFQLTLLMPVSKSFAAIDTVVEPLIPSPVNINTASEDVLVALLTHIRRSANLRINHSSNSRTPAPPSIKPAEARELAAEIAELRGGLMIDGQASGGRPFESWKDLIDRVFVPKLEAAGSNDNRNKWIDVYRCLRTGRDSVLEMGTSPICFKSGPWVTYRASASRSRSLVAPGVVGRHERTGLAAVLPGFRIERQWNTQQAFEDAMILDRRSPGWVSGPINLGHLQPNQPGNDPSARYLAHIVPLAYPSLGLGAARYAVDDTADSGIEPSVAMARRRRWPNTQSPLALDSFATNTHRRGRDVQKEGPYVMNNIGPQTTGGTPPAGGNRRHDQIAFPFSQNGGFMGRFATSFWLEPQTLENTVLFDYGDGNADRNRLTVLARDGNLLVELIDEAGLDPNPSDSPAGVERTASQITLPLAELNLPPDTPVHINLSAPTGRPADISLFVDGMTRGEAKYRTYMTGAMPVFDPSLQNNRRRYGQDPNMQPGNEQFLSIQVESTQGFPPVGILRIGLELFEYSSINGNSFECKFNDSLGGRGARQRATEHSPSIPTDANGEPTVDIDDPQFNGANLNVFPEHPTGSLVELYGYAALVSEDTPMMVGGTALSGALGAFSVARGFVDNPDQIVITPTQGQPIRVGAGFDETWSGDLQLADPIPTGDTQPPNAGQPGIIDAFSTAGGYALIIQERISFEPNIPGQLGGSPVEVGGAELVRYQSRQGQKLIGVQRAQTLPGQDNQIDGLVYDATARKFVTDFNDNWTLPGGQGTWDDLPTLIVWVVPVSIPVQGANTLWDPATTLLTEWVQLLPTGADQDTEWVRYDAIADNTHLVRGNRAAWGRVYNALTNATGRRTVQVGDLGPNQNANQSVVEPPWQPVQPSSGFIGYTPQLESTFPQIFAARTRLGFRGDPFTGTSSHAQNNAKVLQCHRINLLWGNYGAYTGRVGRHDRVALVQGSVASGSNRPNVEWHSVNWQATRYNSDNLQADRVPSELFGPWPFQLIGLRDEVRSLYQGPPQGTVIEDPRMFDRIVKFPSGELPAAFCAEPSIGAGTGGEQPIQGIVDEVEVIAHVAEDLVLEEIMDANAQQLEVNPLYYNNSVGAVWAGRDLSANYPQGGGLIQVDDEVMAYSARDNGIFTIAQNGRGLLNTDPRGHDRGARVKFLTHRACAILTGGVGGSESVIAVQDVTPMPIAGTLLMGQELLHYTWSRNSVNTLEMPNWYPPNADGTVDTGTSAARGLFRGRYGTAPQGASSGEVVISWPFRYWDRFAEFSDDPELAYSQLTTNEAPVFFRDVRWREETTDARVQVICRVRTDSLAPWTAEASAYPGLWEFVGKPADGMAHKLNRGASRIEIRFQTVYQPGCVDLQAFTQHGWKTSARVEDVRVQYEGQGRIFDEQVTAR
ncbi:MAG: hypothetical protein ACI9SE_000859 [Neolewinella sp.]|jgi:hypothetical protein